MSQFLNRSHKTSTSTLILWGSGLTLFLAFVFYPSFSDWLMAHEKSIEIPTKIKTLELKKETVKGQEVAVQEEFDASKHEFEIREGSVLSSFDTYKIAKFLELYALQNTIIENKSFSLESISFDGIRNRKEFPKIKIDTVQLKLVTTPELFQEFIVFLQTNTLPSKFETAKLSGIISNSDYLFLTQNTFPLTKIISIQQEASEETQQYNLEIELYSVKKEVISDE